MGGSTEESSGNGKICRGIEKDTKTVDIDCESGPIRRFSQSSIVERIRAAEVVARAIDRGGTI